MDRQRPDLTIARCNIHDTVRPLIPTFMEKIMADKAATTITELPEKPSQYRLLSEFMDEHMDRLQAKAAELFQHTYLTLDQKYETLVTDFEAMAKEAGWEVSKPVIHAAAGNVMVKHMLDADLEPVKAYPISAVVEVGAPAPDAAAEGAGTAGNANQAAADAQAGDADQNGAQGAQDGKEAEGAIPPVQAAQGDAPPPEKPPGA